METSFVGRQPIFEPNLSVSAYELLFRSDEGNTAQIRDGDQATASVLLSSFADIGLDTLAGKKQAFVNVTRNLLLYEDLSCLPKDRIVLEILEDIEPDEAVLSAVRELSNEGYTLALDDFVYCPHLEPLIELAKIVKIEFPQIPSAQLPDHIAKLRNLGVHTILAEKIETQSDFELCKCLGCDLFQGYFFCRPQVVARRKTPTNLNSILRLVAELQNPDITPTQVEEVIRTDANLSYKLLRFVNSANVALSREIESIRHATVLMGIRRLQSLASMMLLASMDESKPQELIMLALVRAKMCEILAVQSGQERPDRLYTLGLLSVMDAILDLPMSEVIPLLPLTDDMNVALLDHTGSLGEILDSVIKFEAGDFQISALLSREQVTSAYLDALRWTNECGVAV